MKLSCELKLAGAWKKFKEVRRMLTIMYDNPGLTIFLAVCLIVMGLCLLAAYAICRLG
ncbi:hypothetical protein [Sulfitobacter pontiacus]|uniref:hypothetical protein n=1 Tax=Sulfitobacter pontiacus TaxID=60137 RepID=UPI0024202BCD|nr:hypothetical protein [Sulfitobacter pontiacus]|tara:strand:+ start:12226 stop:12399 length:174 start_codon:yes stop_codon:yes gene_type:complete